MADSKPSGQPPCRGRNRAAPLCCLLRRAGLTAETTTAHRQASRPIPVRPHDYRLRLAGPTDRLAPPPVPRLNEAAKSRLAVIVEARFLSVNPSRRVVHFGDHPRLAPTAPGHSESVISTGCCGPPRARPSPRPSAIDVKVRRFSVTSSTASGPNPAPARLVALGEEGHQLRHSSRRSESEGMRRVCFSKRAIIARWSSVSLLPGPTWTVH